MKILKGLGLAILALIGIVLILGLIAPRDFTLERSTVVSAPPEAVYGAVSNLDTWKNWSVWFQMDSTMVVTPGEKMEGLGANYSWTSEDMGSGTQEIIEATPNEHLKTALDFGFMGNANGIWTFAPTDRGTEVTWAMESHTGYPLNAMMLFMDMEESVGNDFEAGLSNLKTYVEENYQPTPTSSPGEISMLSDFGGYYLTKRTETTISGSEAFMQEEMPKLMQAARQAGIELQGPPTGFYYLWDMENDRTDMAVAIPVAEGTVLAGYEPITLKPGPAVAREHAGGYAGLYGVHTSIDEYIQQKNLKMGQTVVEEYHRGPMEAMDSTEWLTRVIYTLTS